MPPSSKPRPRRPKAMMARSAMLTRKLAGPRKTMLAPYKGHVGVDEGTDLIRAATFTSADVHDSVECKNLVSGDEEAAYADEGYPSEEHRAFLAEKGIKDGIMHKAVRGKPLKNWQIWFNKAVAPIRAGVERIFARM